MHIHYTNDFALRLSFYDSMGRLTTIPSGHIAVALSTASMGPTFTAEVGVDETTALDCAGSRLYVLADGHGLAPGRLMVTIKIEAPDDTYPDGSLLHTLSIDTGITLSRRHDTFLAPALFNIPVYLPAGIAGSVTVDGPDNSSIDFPASEKEVLNAVDNAFDDVFNTPPSINIPNH